VNTWHCPLLDFSFLHDF
jgi:hypothetical protein